jgi:hypothetical protein
MNRWTRTFLQVFVALVILALAGLTSELIQAVFHLQTEIIPGAAFLVMALGLCLVYERTFPSVYSQRRRKWWQSRLIVSVALLAVVSISSSRIATLWFWLVMISGALVALFLHAREG